MSYLYSEDLIFKSLSLLLAFVFFCVQSSSLYIKNCSAGLVQSH